MKKTYNKPQIIFESFELSTSIAAGCTQIIPKEDVDLEQQWDKNIFTSSMNCENINCYHVPGPNDAIFTS